MTFYPTTDTGIDFSRDLDDAADDVWEPVDRPDAREIALDEYEERERQEAEDAWRRRQYR